MIHGVINVYKEKGYTSHDVVAKLRGITKQKKIGHTGTLDPDATGVLPVCFGKATKLCGMLTDMDKTYETCLRLGLVTDTQDISGTVLEENETQGLDVSKVKAAICGFQGDYAQIPPMYSALKVNGKKLYELARAGKSVDRSARNVHISKINTLKVELPEVEMEVTCSKGTYIRTLCHDIGQVLDTGGCMKELTRTRVGTFCVQDSTTLSDIEYFVQAEKLDEILIPIDQMFEGYQETVIKSEYESLALNGNKFSEEALESPLVLEDEEKVRVYDNAGHFIAIYKYQQTERTLRVVKMFYSQDDR